MKDFINVLTEQILSAIEKKIKIAPFDKTESGTIVSTLSDGVYLVEVNGEQIQASSSYVGLKKLDKVYVKTRLNNKNFRYISGTAKPLIVTSNAMSDEEGGFALTPIQVEELKNIFTFDNYYASP